MADLSFPLITAAVAAFFNTARARLAGVAGAAETSRKSATLPHAVKEQGAIDG